MEEIALMTIRQALSYYFLIHWHCKLWTRVLYQNDNLHDLPHDGGVEALGELHQSGIEKTLQLLKVRSLQKMSSCRRFNLP